MSARRGGEFYQGDRRMPIKYSRRSERFHHDGGRSEVEEAASFEGDGEKHIHLPEHTSTSAAGIEQHLRSRGVLGADVTVSSVRACRMKVDANGVLGYMIKVKGTKALQESIAISDAESKRRWRNRVMTPEEDPYAGFRRAGSYDEHEPT